MCSVLDLIEKQKFIIESKRKTIKTLYEFLDAIEKPNDRKSQTINKKQNQTKSDKSNGEPNQNNVLHQNIGLPNHLMLGTDGWFDSELGDQKRRKLAEERRREYNEFLQQISNPNSPNSNIRSKRVTTLIPNYNDILSGKRIEERRHRQLNTFDEINRIEDLAEVPTSHMTNGRIFPEVPTVGWFHCSNNKYDPDYITPRSRLLATHSSRVKAAKYSEELRKQVEEKEIIKAAEKEQIRLEEEEYEHKLEKQRLKLFEEFEDEHSLRAQQQIDDQMYKQLPNRDLVMASGSPLSLLRSPTYMHMKATHSPNTFRKKSSGVSRSLSTALSEATLQSEATQTSDQQKHCVNYKDDSSDCDSVSSHNPNKEEEEDEEEEEEKSKENKFRRRILSELSDVRQMMESDHIKMMEQLRYQQLSQMDK